MALPVAAATVVESAVALASRSPGTIVTLGSRLRGMGMQVGSSVNDVIQWVKDNPGQSTMVAATLATLGVQFSGVDGPIADAMKQAALGNLSLEDTIRVFGAADASQTLNLDLKANVSNLAVAVEILDYARRHYGSVTRAMEAHSLHQAFFEMNREDVEAGFQYLRTSN